MSNGQIFVQSNEAEANRVIVFRRAADGSLETMESYATGGAGDGTPHLTSQGSLVMTGGGGRLLVTNAGSGELSVYAVAPDRLELLATVPTGRAPKSVAEHGGLVYALNTGDPSIAGFRLTPDGVEPLQVRVGLEAGSDPAQVGFTPDGSTLVVTDRGTDSILLYPVGPGGELGEPHAQPSSGPTPYGFAFTSDGMLLVTEAFRAAQGKAAASSYRVAGRTATPISRSVGNGRSEICWAVVSNDERFVFTTNFADGAVSRYAIGPDGSITLDDAVAGATVEGRAGLRDESLTPDGAFLYALDADSGRIFGWAVREDGRLDPVGSWNGLPQTVAGLAAS